MKLKNRLLLAEKKLKEKAKKAFVPVLIVNNESEIDYTKVGRDTVIFIDNIPTD